ncbi:N-acetyltransferase [Devosia sp. PTR5]|uniref:N-acetyltransferase n=1 Tax=Devosia oryzisoli TaxID=2774138 RepID=A0A927FZZ1_9HYPH|nr:GNAT family N-acetyltransferase [Devosia oryzisoli]MBD8067191.1 N-acetyltransferase [Devosia oryzisoli]
MAETEYRIAREEGPTRGRYVIELAPGAEAEMTYKKSGDGPMIIDHTGVPPEFEGRGIALRLVKAAVADAREQGFGITPVCPYVVVQFRRHPEWRDLLA